MCHLKEPQKAPATVVFLSKLFLLRAAVYEANIYKIRSTGIDKAAFDEVPLRTKHVPCEKAKEEEHT